MKKNETENMQQTNKSLCYNSLKSRAYILVKNQFPEKRNLFIFRITMQLTFTFAKSATDRYT